MDVRGTGGKSINQFCEDWQMSRAFFYLMRKRGEAPDIMRVGDLQRISFEAEQAWARKRQAASKKEAKSRRRPGPLHHLPDLRED